MKGQEAAFRRKARYLAHANKIEPFNIRKRLVKILFET